MYSCSSTTCTCIPSCFIDNPVAEVNLLLDSAMTPPMTKIMDRCTAALTYLLIDAQTMTNRRLVTIVAVILCAFCVVWCVHAAVVRHPRQHSRYMSERSRLPRRRNMSTSAADSGALRFIPLQLTVGKARRKTLERTIRLTKDSNSRPYNRNSRKRPT